jgi:hypothetical protein
MEFRLIKLKLTKDEEASLNRSAEDVKNTIKLIKL